MFFLFFFLGFKWLKHFRCTSFHIARYGPNIFHPCVWFSVLMYKVELAPLEWMSRKGQQSTDLCVTLERCEGKKNMAWPLTSARTADQKTCVTTTSGFTKVQGSCLKWKEVTGNLKKHLKDVLMYSASYWHVTDTWICVCVCEYISSIFTAYVPKVQCVQIVSCGMFSFPIYN